MSQKLRSGQSARRKLHAPLFAALFAALGDETRLWLLARLSRGERRSISQLSKGSSLTRQAITKHLRILESVGIVHGSRAGRESRFELNPQPIKEASSYLDLVSEQWEQALSRLQSFVERGCIE